MTNAVQTVTCWVRCLLLRGRGHSVWQTAFCNRAKIEGLDTPVFRLLELIRTDWCHRVQSTVTKQGQARGHPRLCELQNPYETIHMWTEKTQSMEACLRQAGERLGRWSGLWGAEALHVCPVQHCLSSQLVTRFHRTLWLKPILGTREDFHGPKERIRLLEDSSFKHWKFGPETLNKASSP